MHLTLADFTALFAVTAQILAAAAGPVDKKADSTSSATSFFPTALPPESTISSEAVRFQFAPPTATDPTAVTTKNGSLTVNTASPNSSLTSSQEFAVCGDAAQPICLPANNSDVYFGETYYVTWNPNYFKPNSTIVILLNSFNDTSRNVWSSGPISSSVGTTAVNMQQDWLQGYTTHNLTFFAHHSDTLASSAAVVYTGPTVQLKGRPQKQYQAQSSSKVSDEMGVKVGIPIGLVFAVVVVAALFLGMRKQRRFSIGNVMGRKRGYGVRKSRWQRLGQRRSKKDDIVLQEQELLRSDEYRDYPPPASQRLSDDSLEEIATGSRPQERNAFRDEVERQKTGGR